MKKMLLMCLFIASVAQSQSKIKYDKFFIEGGFGVGIPVSNVSPSGNESGVLSLAHFQGALRYMITEDIGLMGTLSYDNFKSKSDQKLVGLEVVYNLGNALEIPRSTRESFGLLAHAGFGGGIMSSDVINTDYVGAIIIGVRPMWPVSEKVSIFADVDYKAIFEKDIFYNGVGTTFPKPGKLTSSQIGLTFGAMFAL